MSNRPAKTAVFPAGTSSTVGIVAAFLDGSWLAVSILPFLTMLVGSGPPAGREQA